MNAEWMSVGAVLLLAAIVQSSAGFGAGLVAIPLLLLLGLPLPFAVPMVAGAAMGQCGLGLYQRRRLIQPKLSLVVAVAQWAATPLGALVMANFLLGHVARTRQLAGGIILLLLLTRRFLLPEPKPSRPLGLGLLAGAGAGFLTGAIGMGGPPLVFFALAHSWSAERFRVFLWSQIVLGVPVLLLVLSTLAGSLVWKGFGFGLMAIPVMALGSEIGRRLTRSWDRERVHLAAYALLTLLALGSVVSPWIAG